MLEFLLLLLPVAAASGWMAAKKHDQKNNEPLSKDYFKGLNFLLNEQPDKAIEVFIKVLEVNSDTVETHLALGNLFRKQGEIERAIRIHQNLIANPNLTQSQQHKALFSLAKDYLKAGVLDRAERLLLDAIEKNPRDLDSLNYLLDIYQQEKNWEHAIEITQKLESITNQSRQVEIAQYYCELAEKALQKKELGQARNFLKSALNTDKKSARAALLKAKIEAHFENFTTAIEILEEIKNNNPDYFSETLPLLYHYHEQIQTTEKTFYPFLEKSLTTCPRISSALILTKHFQSNNIEKAKHFLSDYIEKHPSLRGLQYLIELHTLSNSEKQNTFQLIQTLLTQIHTHSPTYLCHQCGFNGKTLLWLCPGCKHWNSIKPILGLEGE